MASPLSAAEVRGTCWLGHRKGQVRTPFSPARDTTGEEVPRALTRWLCDRAPPNPPASPQVLADEGDLFLEMKRPATLVSVELVDLYAPVLGEAVECGKHR